MAAQRKEQYYDALKHLPNHVPNWQPESPHITRRRISQKPKKKLYSVKMILAVCGVGVFALAFMQLYMDSQINHAHYDIQRVQLRINQELSINEQLGVQISELSQHSRITRVAEERGLRFIEENIINITR